MSLVRLPKVHLLAADTGGKEHLDWLAEKFLAAVTEQPLDLGIDEHDYAARFGHNHADRTSLDRESNSLLGNDMTCHEGLAVGARLKALACAH